MIIREKIIAQRKELGFTQKHLAELSGVRKERISEFETGKGNTGVKLVEKLMKVLNLTISKLP
jgi:transcriptional regulator with XRE-family HTH domain